jgi:hypothetical protein
MHHLQHFPKMKKSTAIPTVVLLSVAAAIAFAYMRYSGPKSLSHWSEEVRISSGDVVHVERSVDLGANRIAGGGGGVINRGMALRVTKVRPGLVVPPRWDEKLVPMFIDWDGRAEEWVLVATFYHCNSWDELGRPSLPYVQFRSHGGAWKRSDLDTFLVGRIANLIPATISIRPHPVLDDGLVTEQEREVELSRPTLPQRYKTVVATWDPSNCK